MKDMQDLLDALPDWVTEEKLARVLSHYKDGAFEFDLPTGPFENSEGNTVYHVIPHYAEEGAEDVVAKLRRLMLSDSKND